MAARRASAEARNADFLERAEDVLEATGEAAEASYAERGFVDAGNFW
jgi:hypothetical protein